MADGCPILLATVLPAVVLLLGRLDVLGQRFALRTSVAVAVLQLAGVGCVVGFAISAHSSRAWLFAGTTAVLGITVVALKVVLGH